MPALYCQRLFPARRILLPLALACRCGPLCRAAPLLICSYIMTILMMTDLILIFRICDGLKREFLGLLYQLEGQFLSAYQSSLQVFSHSFDQIVIGPVGRFVLQHLKDLFFLNGRSCDRSMPVFYYFFLIAVALIINCISVCQFIASARGAFIQNIYLKIWQIIIGAAS